MQHLYAQQAVAGTPNAIPDDVATITGNLAAYTNRTLSAIQAKP